MASGGGLIVVSPGGCGCRVGDDVNNDCECPVGPHPTIFANCEHYCDVHDLHHCPFDYTEHDDHFAAQAAAERHDCQGLWDDHYEHLLANGLIVNEANYDNFLNDLLLDGDDSQRAAIERAWSRGRRGGQQF